MAAKRRSEAATHLRARAPPNFYQPLCDGLGDLQQFLHCLIDRIDDARVGLVAALLDD